MKRKPLAVLVVPKRFTYARLRILIWWCILLVVRQPQQIKPPKEESSRMKLDTDSLTHTQWNCKYHIVFAPKYRRQVIYGKIKSTKE